MKLRLGTRASALAQWQAQWVAAKLTDLGIEVLLTPITTTGDRRREEPIERIGAPGAFTKEIQKALLDGRIDLAVHSLKDLLTERVPGLHLAAVPERGAVADVLVAREVDRLEALPHGATVGTGSTRRKTQLLHVRPDLRIKDIRGNVETRLAKLDQGRYDAIILAEAGLVRLGLAQRITQRLPDAVVLSAVGQGALGLEIRDDDAEVAQAISPLDDRATHAAVAAERAMLAALEGGCLAPIAAWATLDAEKLVLRGRVLSADGRQRLDATEIGSPDDPHALGHGVADKLRQQGAAELIAQSRR